MRIEVKEGRRTKLYIRNDEQVGGDRSDKETKVFLGQALLTATE